MSTTEQGIDSIAACETSLYQSVLATRDAHGLEDLAISFYDYETTIRWSYNGEGWFHAASTMKLAVLFAVMGEVNRGTFTLDAPLHVRNRFHSIVDDEPFMLETTGSSDVVASHVGRSMSIRELAHHMISTSSNLATNLLVELVGVDRIMETLQEFGVQGVRVLRGVQDERAFEEGRNNEVTADGLMSLLRLVAESRAWSVEASAEMLEILHAQQYRSGIPAGLPEEAKVAHKTGNISTVHHDAGIVFLEDREPYILVILTRFRPETGRGGAVADVSRDIHASLAGLRRG